MERLERKELQMSLYSAAMLTMKKFLKVFQQEEPAVYRIHTDQLNVFMEFLIDFVKPEVIAQNKDAKKLKSNTTECYIPCYRKPITKNDYFCRYTR